MEKINLTEVPVAHKYDHSSGFLFCFGKYLFIPASLLLFSLAGICSLAAEDTLQSISVSQEGATIIQDSSDEEEAALVSFSSKGETASASSAKEETASVSSSDEKEVVSASSDDQEKGSSDSIYSEKGNAMAAEDDTIILCGEGYSFNPSSGVLSVWKDDALDATLLESLGNKIHYVSIGKNVTDISEDVFTGLNENVRFLYAGTDEEWAQLVSAAEESQTFSDTVLTESAVLSHPGSYTTYDVPLALPFCEEDLTENGYTFSVRTAIYAIGLELASFTSYNAEDSDDTEDVGREQNLAALFSLLGFENAEYSGYDVPLSDTSEKAAFAIAEKTVTTEEGEQTLVAVVIRGGRYGAEWSSNMYEGTGTYHEGFYESALPVVEALKEYLSQYTDPDENVRILITGYSRGAAVANLTAALLDEDLPENIQADDICAYCFACPNTVRSDLADLDNPLYDNIFCIVNITDIVPQFPFNQWGYDRFGVTLSFPSDDTDQDLQEEIFAALAQLNTEEETDSSLSEEDTSESGLISLLADAGESAENYAATLQGGFMIYFGFLSSGSDLSFEEQMSELYGKEAWEKACQTVQAKLPLQLGKASALIYSKLSDTFSPLLTVCYLEGASINDLAEFLDKLISGLIKNPSLSSLFSSGIGQNGSSLLSLFTGHSPELYLAGILSTFHTNPVFTEKAFAVIKESVEAEDSNDELSESNSSEQAESSELNVFNKVENSNGEKKVGNAEGEK